MKGQCAETVSRVVVVDLPSQLEIPNIFTPNNDGVNDLFFLKATSLEWISIVVYSRWGLRVYELESFTGNVAWDGKDLYGKNVADGTYMYVLKAKGRDGSPYESKGTIMLVR